MLLFSAQYHTLCFYLSHWRTAAQRTLADPAFSRTETDPKEPTGKVFPQSHPTISLRIRSDWTFSCSSVLHSHISHLYISIYTPCCYVWLDEKRQFWEVCSCGGLAAAVLLSFLCPLQCLPNTVDLNEEKSLINPPPPAHHHHLPISPSPDLQNPNQVAEDAKFT